MGTIRLRGIEEANTGNALFQPGAEGGQPPLSIKAKGRVRLGAARDFGGLVDLNDMQSNDVACVEYSNGFKLWTRVDDLYAEHGKSAMRGGGADPDIWELEPQTRTLDADRGAGRIVIEALEFFGVDLKSVATFELCKWFEAKQLQAKGPGLYRFDSLGDPFKLDFLQDQKIAAGDKKLLLFIHGTGSSSQGGFDKLWSDTGFKTLKALQAVFGTACYAFEHRSLTVSPIDNALAIAEALPEHAEIHLVTHSRGGLVGELLCLGQRDKTPDPLHDDFLDKVFDPEQDRTQGELFGFGFLKPEGYTVQKQQLRKLLDKLDEKQIKVVRFVRVACPARGTTLASGRLDRWLSVLNFLSGSNAFVEFLLGVVRERTDPRTLPGIEAMMPGSALVTLLNERSITTQADLTVIAGDIEGDSFWNKLKLQLADWFYSSEHDLVVNTGSMYGGLLRSEGAARFFFAQGQTVNHFNYFKNPDTIEKLKEGLLRSDADQAGYQPISAAKQQEPARGVKSARAVTRTSGPLAIVLPGTMGSHLRQDGERIWLDFIALSQGRLVELGITAPNVEPDGLLADFYADFVGYLETSHRVEPFYYDWRVSIIDSAKKLGQLVENRLSDCEARHQPLRFVAHSLGGLVVRVMFAMQPQLWKRFQALPGSRFMMLGTPNAGSYEAVRWLTGWNPTLGQIAMLDFAHDVPALVNIVNRFPGLLELLPSNDGKLDYANPRVWKQICSGGDQNWPQPQADSLQALSRTWQWVNDSPIDSERMIYIAGWAKETVSDFENQSGRGLFSKKRPPLRFYSTGKGDGTVPWALGRLPGVKTWYVEAAHDQLLTHAPAFPAYLDLLQTGATSRLSQNEPASSRAADGIQTPRIMQDAIPDSLPTEADLSGFVFGAARPRKRHKARRLPMVNVSIRHGDLAYARHPICVGHYYGDTIVSAEAALDKYLDGVLSKRVSLGLYPGELNTHEVFFHHEKNAQPNGAIVIGLGRVGELSPGTLTAGVASALLDYALKISEWPDDRFGAMGTTRSAKVSFLLIGTGSGGMSIRNSMEAILAAVKSANNRLVESGLDSKVLFDDIEFLEIYRDYAILASRALEDLLHESPLESDFHWPDHSVQAGTGGLQRVVFDSDPAWWHRLEIVYDDKYQMLRFIALTDRARAEVSLVSGQMRLADQYIADMLSSTGSAMQSAQTLFEMLIPNRLKELAPNQYDVVLIVDEVSARYPWELMADRWNASKKPPAVAAGMLRQLKTQQFRAKPLHTAEKTALVIGNPAQPKGVDFPDLPGAAQEAEAVAALLGEYDYDVNKALGRRQSGLEAKAIMTGLHAEAYRILHLAGHGAHEFPIQDFAAKDVVLKRVSGMAIGDGIFLTPGDIEQMRWVPELVFINCCHLGSTEVRYPEARRYNELAANLGTQFINMGVRAVVAAGWAVDDAAAKVFAESFYRAILSGLSFGYAIRIARQQIYDQFPDVNTWGAYQCYGDPDFSLCENGGNPPKPAPRYHDKSEWLADLDNLLSKMHSNSGKQDHDQARQSLDRLIKRVPADLREKWYAQADVAALLGTLYGEMADYELALHYLDKAFSANKAEFPVKALEQRANYRVKHALRFLSATESTDKAKAIADIEQSIKELKILSDMAPTLERLSMLGSAYKRLAWMQSAKNNRKQALEHMCEFYRLAYQKGLETKNSDAYPFTNWISAEAILAWFDKNRDQSWRQDLEKSVAKLIADAKQKLAVNPQYWDSVVEPDCLSLLSLVKGELAEEDFNRIAAAYRLAAERGASYKDQSALHEHLEFLISMATAVKKQALAKKYEELLRYLA